MRLDFDDLIMKTVQLLRESEKAREHYQNRFHFVHCDEFQDVNDSQYQLLKLFSGKYKNICAVGDDDQCVVEGTPILTPNGYVPVEQIKEGDEVLAACGGYISRSDGGREGDGERLRRAGAPYCRRSKDWRCV